MPDGTTTRPPGRWATLVDRARSDTEFAQTLVRFPVGILFVTATFIFAEPATAPIYGQVFDQLIWAMVVYGVVAATLSWHVARYPGHLDWRRQAALVADNIAIGMLMMTGAETMLPAFAGLLWVTVGFGMRYGPRYLLLSIAAALVTCSIVAGLNPWWRDHPAIPATLIFTILVTPTYAFFLHARLRRAQMASEAATVAKSRFLAQVSHDLRQPLHAMGLMSANIVDADSPELRRDLADRIDRSVHDARELLQTFLDRSIIETGRLTALPRPFALGELLLELEQANRAAAAWDGTRLRIVPTSAWVSADRAFVRTMLQNLIANALKVAPGRGVVVGCRRQGHGLVLAVFDSGPGIDAAFMARVADPATDPGHLADGRHAGMGLGLSIVWRLAQQHGFTLRFRTVAGRGTAFLLGPLAMATPASMTATATPSQTPLTGAHVLLTGSDDTARNATAALLTGWGCVVEERAQLPSAAPVADLLILDLEQRADAAALEQWLRAPPVLALTSHAGGDARQWLGAAPALLATKPVTAAELRSLVMAALAQARANQAW